MSGPGRGRADDALHVRVEGRVQGVGFRRFVQRAAVELALSGWARNLTDGSVEVAATGRADAIEALRRRLLEGPPYAAVDRLVPLDADARTAGAATFRLLPDAAPGEPPGHDDH